MTLTRGFIRNAVTTPLDARLMNMAQIVGNSDGSPRPGVLDGDGRALVTPLATMNVAVAAADFVTTKGTADGVAIFTNDGTVNVPITAAPASNSRIDVIWVKHNDNTTGDANSTPVFGVTAGTAAASPTKPSIPTGALELATIRVYAGTTAANGGTNVTTNTYQMTASRGGVVPFRTRADLLLWANPAVGQLAHVLDASDGGLYRWNGTAWKRIGGAMIGAKVMRNAAQSLPNGAFTPIQFDTEVFDVGACWAPGRSTRLVAPIAGVYLVTFAGGLATAVGGRVAAQLRRNGATLEYGGTLTPTASAPEVGAAGSTLVSMSAGDYLELQIYQESGGAVNTGSSGYSRPTVSFMWQGEV